MKRINYISLLTFPRTETGKSKDEFCREHKNDRRESSDVGENLDSRLRGNDEGRSIQIVQTLFAFLIFASFSLSSYAADTGSTALKNFFDNLNSLTADFEQTVQSAQLSTVERAAGKLWIKRPGKFRWNYETPYEQQIVSDGNKIWIYDTDLEQVTVKNAKTALGHTPALLLSGTQPVDVSFTLKDLESETDLSWVELTPKDTEAGFNSIRLGFKDSKLKEMLLKDNLGQITQISFENLQIDTKLESSLFDFIVPEGADVFDTGE